MGFNLFNISVIIQPTFWLFLLIFSFNPNIPSWQMFLLAAVVFFSLLFHEYGHALAAKKFGRFPTITLENFGGYASYNGRGMPEKHHFIITLCGPLFTALLIAISYYLLQAQIFHTPIPIYFLHYTMQLNIYWLIVNLAPLNPLDGGKITEYLLNKWFGAPKGHRFTLLLGNITAAIGGLYFLFQGSYMFAYVFLFHGWRNWQAYTSEYRKQKPSAFSLYHEALQALENQEHQKAQTLFEKLSKSKDDYIKIHSLESLAELLDRVGKPKEAYNLLAKTDPQKLNRGKWLLCKLAYAQGNYSLIEKFSQAVYEAHPTFDTALLNAKAFAQLKRPSYAVAWLQTALQFEEAKAIPLTTLLADPAFLPLHQHPEFAPLLADKQPISH